MTIIEIIKKNRPNLSQSSIRSYNSIIKNLAKALEITIESKADVSKNLKKIMLFLQKDILYYLISLLELMRCLIGNISIISYQ